MPTIRWPLIILISAFGIALMMVGNIESPIRPLLAFWFLLVCPGMAFVRLLRVDRRLTEWTLAIALSIAIDVIVTEIMVLGKLWSPTAGLMVIISISIVGIGLQLRGSRAALVKFWRKP